jgi:hypothetical protein
MAFDCKDYSTVCALFNFIWILYILTRPHTEVRHANSALGLDEFMMRITLQEGLWDYDQLEKCGAADLLAPIGTWVTRKSPRLITLLLSLTPLQTRMRPIKNVSAALGSLCNSASL